MHHPDAVMVNTLVRQALLAAQEVIGENGVNTILRASRLEQFIGNFPPDNLEPAIQAAEYARFKRRLKRFMGAVGAVSCDASERPLSSMRCGNRRRS